MVHLKDIKNGAYGKIKDCMQSVNNDIKYAPPRMIPSIVEGFNAITHHIYIILFPIILDVLLWLGPLVSVKKYFLPLLMEALKTAPAAFNEQALGFVDSTRLIWVDLINRFNLLSSLRTLPIGVPSLMINILETATPLGDRGTIELSSGDTIFIWTIIFLLVGILLGSIYFALTASAVKGSSQPFESDQIIKKIAQSFFLALILFTGVVVLALPVTCLLSTLLLVIPSLGTLPFLLVGMLSVWVLLPLAFSPHGIFSGELKAARSIVTSIRLVRSLMSPTGIFFILLILLGYGLDILWATPSADDWMLFVGIIGHAFISSGLLAASFIYYEKGVKWMSNTIQPNKQEKPAAVS